MAPLWILLVYDILAGIQLHTDDRIWFVYQIYMLEFSTYLVLFLVSASSSSLLSSSDMGGGSVLIIGVVTGSGGLGLLCKALSNKSSREPAFFKLGDVTSCSAIERTH